MSQPCLPSLGFPTLLLVSWNGRSSLIYCNLLLEFKLYNIYQKPLLRSMNKTKTNIQSNYVSIVVISRISALSDFEPSPNHVPERIFLMTVVLICIIGIPWLLWFPAFNHSFAKKKPLVTYRKKILFEKWHSINIKIVRIKYWLEYCSNISHWIILVVYNGCTLLVW